MLSQSDRDTRMPEVFLIAAVAKNGVIGSDNAMPWRLPSDLKQFKALTLGKPVVMGRKTFESLGRPLPGRANVVITRNSQFRPEGVFLASDLNDGLAVAQDLAAQSASGAIAVIGGGEIYRQAMAIADRLEITEVDAEPEGDTVFPAIDPAVWREVARVPGLQGAKDSTAFTFVTYRRAHKRPAD